MTHAFSLVPNFSVPLAAPPVRESVPFHADPVLAAIDAHEESWVVFQVAPEGEAAQRAKDACYAALVTLLGTPCATRAGAFALLRHLRWFLEEEAPNAAAHGDAWQVAQAREADLTLLLGCDGVRRIPVALPLGRLVSVPVLPEAPKPLVIDVGPARAPALTRLGRAFSSAGEVLVALALIVGGTALVGIATLV